MKIKQKITMEFIKKQLQNPAYFLAAVTTGLIAVTLVFGLTGSIKSRITNKSENIATSTDATPTDATPTNATPTDVTSTDEAKDITENAAETGADTTVVPANEENYIEGISAVITGTYDDNTPVTEKCIETFKNEYFDITDIESIEACVDLCDFSTKDACYNITISGKTYCYGVRFTISEATGAINYLSIYEIPSPGIEIDAGIMDIGEVSTEDAGTETRTETEETSGEGSE